MRQGDGRSRCSRSPGSSACAAAVMVAAFALAGPAGCSSPTRSQHSTSTTPMTAASSTTAWTSWPVGTSDPQATPFVIQTFFDGKPALGFEMNIDNQSHTYDWLFGDDSAVRAGFLPGQSWAAVFITLGPPRDVGQRTQAEDLTACDTLAVGLRAEREGVRVAVGIKDTGDPDEDTPTLYPLTIGTAAQTYLVPLAELQSADLSRVYLPFMLVYTEFEAVMVWIDNVAIYCRQ